MLPIIYSMACIIVPCAVYQVLALREPKSRKHLLHHMIWVYIFLLYLYLALSTAGIGSVWDIGKYDTIIRPDEINFIPFQSEGIMTYVLNILMFMPLGFLLPLIWKNYRNITNVLFTGFGFSLSIEICQLFNLRATDIDDLLMNTLGTLIGYFIWLLLINIFQKCSQKALSLSKREPAVYLALAVAGEFLLYNWRLLL